MLAWLRTWVSAFGFNILSLAQNSLIDQLDNCSITDEKKPDKWAVFLMMSRTCVKPLRKNVKSGSRYTASESHEEVSKQLTANARNADSNAESR